MFRQPLQSRTSERRAETMLMAETWSLWVFVSLISGGRSVGFLRPGVGLVVLASVLPEGVSVVRASSSVVSRVVSTFN